MVRRQLEGAAQRVGGAGVIARLAPQGPEIGPRQDVSCVGCRGVFGGTHGIRDSSLAAQCVAQVVPASRISAVDANGVLECANGTLDAAGIRIHEAQLVPYLGLRCIQSQRALEVDDCAVAIPNPFVCARAQDERRDTVRHRQRAIGQQCIGQRDRGDAVAPGQA